MRPCGDIVRARKARRASFAGAPLISPATLYPHRRRNGDALVAGTPAGGGGLRRGARRARRERLLIAPARRGARVPYTNPSWTPLFERAAAVVVDTGGLASHAAIVAREYGIPAVMGTGVGTGCAAPTATWSPSTGMPGTSSPVRRGNDRNRRRPRDGEGRLSRRRSSARRIAELEDAGYARMSMDAVAERARVSKASLYRRWPGKRPRRGGGVPAPARRGRGRATRAGCAAT